MKMIIFLISLIASSTMAKLNTSEIDRQYIIQQNCAPATYCLPWQKKNRFSDLIEHIQNKCTFLGYSSKSCERLVKDTFEISSPHCPEGKISEQATNCTMLSKYIALKIVADFNKYQIYLNRTIDLIYQNKSNSINVYSVLLETVNNEKTQAIFLMGLFINSQQVISILNDLGKAEVTNSISEFINSINKLVAQNIKFDVFPESISNDLSSNYRMKGYHFWTRAILSSQLKGKGHSSLISRVVATATSAYYEFFIDWQEHKAEGMTFENRFKNAISDVVFSDGGSRFGVDD